MEKVITSFQVDKDVLSAIDNMAASEGRSRSSWMRKVLSNAMQSDDKDPASDDTHELDQDTGTAG